MNCEICDKSFTGKINFEQHKLGRKHMNKLQLFQKFAPKTAEQFNSTSLIYCSICDVKYDNISDYQKHAETLEHSEMVSRGNSSSPNNAVKKQLVEKYSVELTAKCELCDKQFSGLKPYEQHLESAPHKRKNEILVTGVIEPESSFFCKICLKQCTGPVPYTQHLESPTHKRKELKNFHVDNPAWYCKVCDMQCTGPAPYSQHMSGKIHLKKLDKAGLLNLVFSKEISKKDELASDKKSLVLRSPTLEDFQNQKEEIITESSARDQNIEKMEQSLLSKLDEKEPRQKLPENFKSEETMLTDIEDNRGSQENEKKMEQTVLHKTSSKEKHFSEIVESSSEKTEKRKVEIENGIKHLEKKLKI